MQDRQASRSRTLKDVNVKLPEDFSIHLRDLLERMTPSKKTSYLREVCFSKFVSTDTQPADVRRNRAVFKWLCAEQNNAATNDRLELTPDGFQILPRVLWSDFVSKCRDVVRTVIGDVPSEDALIGIFSGGASTSRGRTVSHPANKYLGKADVTESAKGLFEDLLKDMPGWLGYRGDAEELRVVPGNIMFTVPKTTDIDRCACKEPDINMFMQKGLGGEIRRGLKRHKIDLNDQSINRDLARIGSITGDLATLDLSSASDSVTTGLVELLLPTVWYSYLSMLRSPYTDVFGELHRNEMFSSMGNGFTFELESLLFYAIARTTAYFRGVSGVISVYGDDIIVPSILAEDLTWVLGYCGFEVNPSKSYWFGTFRESCGGHYDGGIDITPFYVKKPVTDLVSLIHLGNSLRKWAGSSGWMDEEVYPLWKTIKELVPERFWGGRDLASKEALVTSDLPRKKLLPITRRVETGTGGYILWLNATMNRMTDGCVETSTRSIDCGRYRVRPNATPYTSMTTPLFEEEWQSE
uniref:RNA-directed RNA polymerase n=1 Tax=Hubei levi-like virus 5 TaxID=1922917 RepID=A0A1L3KIU5_9VIRU|nr:hypothetical protein [Hubei levi-like virus 5]